MKLTKENVYVDLRGKSEEELMDLYKFLNSIGEKLFRDCIEWFLSYSNLEGHFAHLSYRCDYANWGNTKTENKQEVTIEQLKEILKPMDLTLEQQLKKAEAEVKRLKEAIEASKIKEGEWCKFWNYDKSKFIIAKYQGNKFACITTGVYFIDCEKITDSVLLESLNF